MNNQILFIYELPFLFDIFEEIKENLNFKIINLTKKEITKTNFSQYENYLILFLYAGQCFVLTSYHITEIDGLLNIIGQKSYL